MVDGSDREGMGRGGKGSSVESEGGREEGEGKLAGGLLMPGREGRR